MHQKKQKPRKPKYAANKKAFDIVMQAYRDAVDTSLGAMSYENTGKSTPNPARPTPIDLRCDIDKVLNKLVAPKRMPWFKNAYIRFDSLDPIEQEMHADKTMGKGRHELEQSLGAAFIKVRIYPLSGDKGYFHCIRREIQ